MDFVESENLESVMGVEVAESGRLFVIFIKSELSFLCVLVIQFVSEFRASISCSLEWRLFRGHQQHGCQFLFCSHFIDSDPLESP